MLTVKRGQIYYCDLSPSIGSEQSGLRPCVIIQNDIGNKHSPCTIVAPITSAMGKATIPTHIRIDEPQRCGLKTCGYILCEQIRVIDKKRITNFVGNIPPYLVRKMDEALKESIGVR